MIRLPCDGCALVGGKRQGACHFVEHRFALFTSFGGWLLPCPPAAESAPRSRRGRATVMFCAARLSDRSRRGRLSPAEPSTPTMITKRVMCLVRSVAPSQR